MKQLIAHLLVFVTIVQSTALAAGSSATSYTVVDKESGEAVKLSADEIQKLKDMQTQIGAIEFGSDAMGGKIVNKDKPGTEIYLSCVEEDAQNRCAKVQYMYREGLITSPISSVVTMLDLRKAFDAIKARVNSVIQATIDAQTKTANAPDVFAITKSDASGTYYGDFVGDTEAGTTFFVLGSIAFCIAIPLLLTGGTAASVLAGLIVSGVAANVWGWPVLGDLALMPFKAIGYAVKSLAVKIHNRHVMRKEKRRIKRIEIALETTVQDGQKVARVRGEDFAFILKTFDDAYKADQQQSSAPNNGSIK